MWFQGKPLALRIILAVLLVLIVGFDILLIVEAAYPGENSTEQSTAFGTAVAEVVNNIAEAFGDDTPPITDMESFLGFFRKLVGHYGAFLVLALAATPFFTLGFSGWHWRWSIAVNFAHGFAMACLTEFIQLFTAGRSGAWSDVGIDFGGYCTSAVLVTFIILLVHFLAKRKNEKAVDNA